MTHSPQGTLRTSRRKKSFTVIRIVGGLLLAGLAAWFIAKEAIEPHWLIRLGDLVRPGPPPLRLELGNGLALHAYGDTRPHVGKIATLQKGLVLVVGGQELIEEGYGFGVPILVRDGRSFLSQHADVGMTADGKGIFKRFRIDVEDTWTQPFRRKYRTVEPLGTVVFTYTVASAGVLEVTADFQGLTPSGEADLAYVANEQGARPFRLYSDSSGISRIFSDVPDTPDQWIPTTAQLTCFTAEARAVRFCVETQPGQAKYVGRERYNQYRWSGIFWLSWAGTDIELRPPPDLYTYRVIVDSLVR